MKYKDYKLEDRNSREEYLGARVDIIQKNEIINLWIKVIEKAKDDIIRYYDLKNKYPDKNFKEEKRYMQEANSFLFDDDHIVPWDDYIITIECPICHSQNNLRMSNFASEIEMCRICAAQYSPEDAEIGEINNIQKEVTFKELLNIIYNITDVNEFRTKLREKILETIRSKTNGNYGNFG